MEKANNARNEILKRAYLGALCLGAMTMLANVARADVTDFGGENEKYKGAGDKVPPQCSLDLPKSATEAFTAKWFCTDNFTDQQDIRTELWIYRKDSAAASLLTSFLGFPAAGFVDAKALNAATVKDGLPASFRLVAVDKAGITTISPLETVSVGSDSSASGATCNLTITSAGTESTEDVTGTAAGTVTVTGASVDVSVSSGTISVSTGVPETPDTCEIAAICDSSEDGKITFSASATVDSDAATGTITVTPGIESVSATGTATATDTTFSSLELSGTTTLDGASATVEISCSQASATTTE